MPSDARTGETRESLLLSTQEYLQALCKHRAPDSVLAEAWEEFYRVYSELIRRYAIAQGIRDADVDDCVQEVWAGVATKLIEFQRPANRPGLRAWLYTLVRSRATDLLRRKARQPAKELGEAIEAGQEPRGSEPDPAALYERQWEDATVETILAELRTQLSVDNYRVLHMRFVEGREVAEVAATLDMTPEQVRSRQHRMMQKLRAHMAVYTGEGFGEKS